MKPKNNNSKGGFAKVGAILRSKEGSLYIKFDKDTNIEINGVRVSGLSANLEKPSVKFERMLAAGKISEEEAAEEIAKYEEGGEKSYVRQEISVKLG